MASDGVYRGMSSSRLPHSHSTPAGVDGAGTGPGTGSGTSRGTGTGPTGMSRTPPSTPKKGVHGKMLAIRVQMLDDSVAFYHVQGKALGRILFEQVCNTLNLLEADYFGLEYLDMNGAKYWLDLEKPLSRQVGLSLVDTFLRFCVKFYTPDPSQLEEEYTRYLFCLQVKRDLALGAIQCNDNTAALMASYIVQAECGDFVQEDYPDHTYLSSYKFVPHQDHDLERRIMENHKKHAGQSPAEADLNLLETARRCELYGMKMHPAKDPEGVPLNLAVAHMGIVVFQNYTKINTFSWAKIRKISFKRKRFLIKLHPEGYGLYKDTVEFFFEGRNECKNFWKKCVENHGFFRCSMVKRLPRQKTRVLSRGSSFRYSGKTQKQIVDFVRENYVKRQTFQRSQSFRHSSSVHSSVANVGPSVSAHPLLPLGDNEVVGTQASLSCGSMTLNSMTETADQSTSLPRRHYPNQHRYRTTSLTQCTNTHTADIHEVGDMDTSPECGASLTASPRPGTATGTEEEDSPYHHPHRAGKERTPEIPPLPRLPQESDYQNGTNNKNSGLGSPASFAPKTNGTLVLDTKNVDAIDGNRPPDVSPIKSTKTDAGSQKNNVEIEVDVKKKRYSTDRAYFIAKEILMTERTYKKDLEVINVWFRSEVKKEVEMPPELDHLFLLIDPISGHQQALLREIELRVTTWEGRGSAALRSEYQRVGDVLLRHFHDVVDLYSRYMDEHYNVIESLDLAFSRNKKFEQLYRAFELQKICYLPLSALILKPLQRLLHYQVILDRLLRHHSVQHPDYADCTTVKKILQGLFQTLPEVLKSSENLVQLCELQREMAGFDSLVQPDREFLRQGCLLKHSRRGYQQRMFFLFSDILLYTNRIPSPTLHFQVRGQMPLRGVMVEEAEVKMGSNHLFHCFTIYGGTRALTVAGSCQEEKDKWLEDINRAVDSARERKDDKVQYLSLKSCSSSDEVIDKCGDDALNKEKTTASPQRSNTTVHVCWHRNTSISMADQLRAVENQLSGFLLRKFKNSSGWQKLWVVFTNFCLFFYKTFQDDSPLASLPLLGYTVTTPAEKDGIQKDYVFKLQFKNHVYFFRAESEYTFGRWMEVISSATQHAGRARLFSRKDSSFEG